MTEPTDEELEDKLRRIHVEANMHMTDCPDCNRLATIMERLRKMVYVQPAPIGDAVALLREPIGQRHTEHAASDDGPSVVVRGAHRGSS